MRLGDILRDLLDKHDMSQKEFARILNITPAALGNYIHNTREPDYKTLLRIAEYFDVSTDFLLNHHCIASLSYDEETLLHIFRLLTPEQQEFYLEQGKIFIKQNKKTSSPFSEDDVLPQKSTGS